MKASTPSIWLALTWEFYRLIRIWIVPASTFAFLLTILISCMIAAKQSFDVEFEVLQSLATIVQQGFTWVEILAFISAIMAAHCDLRPGHEGFRKRLFAFPVSTSTLVVHNIVTGAVAIVLMMAVSWLLYFLAFGLTPPFWGPVLLTIAVYTAVVAVFWATAGLGALRFVFVIAILLILPLWMVFEFGEETFHSARSLINDVALNWWWLLASTSVASIGVAIAALNRERSGDVFDAVQLWRAIVAKTSTARGASDFREFRSPESALRWAEWKQRGHALPLLMAGSSATIIIAYMASWMGPKAVVIGFFVIGIAQHVLPGVVGFSIGTTTDHLASLPMSSTKLAVQLLRVGGSACVISWLIWLAGSLVAFGLLYMNGASQLVTQLVPTNFITWQVGVLFIPLLVLTTILTAWSGLGISQTLGMFIRSPSSTVWLGILCEGLAIAAFVIYGFLPDPYAEIYRSLWWHALGIAGIGITIAAIVHANRREFLSDRHMALLGGLWLGEAAIAIALWVRYGFPPVAEIVLAAGLLCMPVLPFASVPLAFDRRRHG